MSDLSWGALLLGAYVLLVVLARWIYIARTNVVWTSAQSEAMGKRLSLQVAHDRSANGEAPVTRDTLLQLVQEISNKKEPKSKFAGVIGWNGSHQIAQWVLIHEAERMALRTLGHEELVARLERALGQLDELPERRREAWEIVIHTLLATRDDTEDERRDRAYRAYLDELLGELYEASNGTASQLSGLYNRATWIILVALLPLGVLVGLGYGMLLVAGAIGGLVSRMQRLVFTKRIPITYGSSWAPLFCAPVLGALAAWAGLVLIALLQATGVVQLGGLHTSVDDLRAPSSALLGTAILLGMSERFLLRLEKQAEAVIDPNGRGPSERHAPVSSAATVPRVRRQLRPQAQPVATATADPAGQDGGAAAPGAAPAG